MGTEFLMRMMKKLWVSIAMMVTQWYLVNVLNAIELCTYEWLNNKYYVYLTIIKRNYRYP